MRAVGVIYRHSGEGGGGPGAPAPWESPSAGALEGCVLGEGGWSVRIRIGTKKSIFLSMNCGLHAQCTAGIITVYSTLKRRKQLNYGSLIKSGPCFYDCM